jgi:hypothetical protein
MGNNTRMPAGTTSGMARVTTRAARRRALKSSASIWPRRVPAATGLDMPLAPEPLVGAADRQWRLRYRIRSISRRTWSSDTGLRQ